MKRAILLGLVALLLCGTSAYGQALQGSITVTVVDNDGGVLPGATVEAVSDQTLSRRSEVTDESGIAIMRNMAPAANYIVTTTMDGFNGARNENVLVKAGQNTPIRITLSLASITEELIVTAESPVVDITSAQTGQDITLDLVESLPTARTYQDYLQLVPGVQASVVDADGNNNPASRSGVNYSDIGGDVGSSSDNFYYFEGINVTDGVNGTAGANINTEIIQEQSVATGGLEAQFVGATGLVSNVITKSGGNNFSGSVNYFFQNDGLVADNDNRMGADFSTYDTAFTLGGPIVRDKAWFFTSYRLVNREQLVVDPQSNPLRNVTRDDDQVFGKVSWAVSQSGLLTGIFLSDPWERDGSFNDQRSNNRDITADRGGDRITGTYSHVFNSVVLEVGYADNKSDLNTTPTNLATRNDITFRAVDEPADLNLLQVGGDGTIFIEERGTEALRGSLEYLADTSWGSHTLKFGGESSENSNFRNFVTTGDGGIYSSLSGIYSGQGVTAGEISSDFSVVNFDPNNQSDFNGLIATINSHPNRAAFYGLLDSNHDGTITQGEVAANLVFDSTAGNPDAGFINYDRTFQTSDGDQFTKSEGTTFFLQDTWQWKNWSVNLGVRTEEWKHFSTSGENIYTFDNEIAPRLSITYDLKGDGRQRLSAYYGRYYDPIRNNMTNFAGSVTGRERREQVFVGGEWLTYRIRGGPAQADALFAPTTQTPYTDEFQIGYKIDLGSNMSFEVNAIKRTTEDILEDYDLGLYADPDVYGLPVDHPDSLFLGLGYFGYDTPPVSNFVIATLAGGNRDWEGLEFVFRKRMSNNWQMLASYNYADGTGNTNSDSNADFQGDVLWLDPRAINQEGTQPGLVEHLFKVAGTYQWDNGLSVGGTYRWNSGTVASRTFRASGRNLPLIAGFNDPLNPNPIQFAGGSGQGVAGGSGFWLSPDSVGALTNPSYGTLDLRVSYLWNITGNLEADIFLDIFNALDDQATIREQDIVSGNSGVAFGEGLDFVDPQRFYLGARLRF
jgi:hypothetical protein